MMKSSFAPSGIRPPQKTDSLPFRFIEVPPAREEKSFARQVEVGLSGAQKSLPPRFFYDGAGSRLFEQICRLPEYYLTRTEQHILNTSAPEMIEAAGDLAMLVEFGSGSSVKTHTLLAAALERQRELHYVPIDISPAALREAVPLLLDAHERVTVTALAAEYQDAMPYIPDHPRPRLFLMLGSNIGNYDPAETRLFLADLRHTMNPDDRALIGIDLLKDRTTLEAAYNDCQGVTARFNKNLLARINRELGGGFNPDDFEHQAPFVAEKSRIEMHLHSRREQSVSIAALEREFHFAHGESIHTENSNKYSLEQFADICTSAGLEIEEEWLDPRAWFAEVLLKSTRFKVMNS